MNGQRLGWKVNLRILVNKFELFKKQMEDEIEPTHDFI